MFFSYHRLCAWRGARLMDRSAPGWALRTDPRRLHLGSGVDCVLGQEYGNYPAGLMCLDLHGLQAAWYGFTLIAVLGVPGSLPCGSWDRLTAAWLTEIRKRVPAPVPVTGRRTHGLAA